MPALSKKSEFYFIGVTTSQSSMMKIFPLWMRELGLPDVDIVGYDIEIHGPAEKYREVVKHIKEDRNVKGGLVTTHKIDIVQAAHDLFDYFDEYARVFCEISSISKRDGKLRGHAKDPISVGLTLESFLPRDYWINNRDAQVFIMGSGGSGVALSAYLMKREHGKNTPSKIIISNRNPARLDLCRGVHDKIGRSTEVVYVQVGVDGSNDDVVRELPEGSLIVNATGMGKDRPGSPLSNGILFPENGIIWEFNYRGSLEFLHQAENQKMDRNLHVEDGWIYFIYGWTLVIEEVFNIRIGSDVFLKLGGIAKSVRL